MPRTNLHIFLSSIESETRLFKEAAFTLGNGILDRVVVFGLWADGLAREETTPFGLEIQRKPTLIRRYKNFPLVGRVRLLSKALAALSLLQYSVAAILFARRLRPDHVSCHNAAMLPVSWVASKLVGATLEYLPHELETQRAGLTWIKHKIESWIERRFIPSARHVVVVNDFIADWYRDTYGLKNLYEVRNMPEQATLAIREMPEGDFRTRFQIPDSATVFIYQGLFGKARGTTDLIEMFARLDPARGHLVMMGYGDGTEQTEVEEAAARLPNVHYQPAVPRDWIISYTSGADVGLNAIKTAPLSYRYSLPNKFFEYTHAGLAVIVSRNLEYMANLIDQNAIGWAIDFDQVEEKICAIAGTDLSAYRERTRTFAQDSVWETDAAIFNTVYAPKDIAL